MRILIVGGTGFLGPHVVRTLDRLGHEVIVFHRGMTETALPSSVRHVRDASAALPVVHFPRELIGERPEVVVHMMAMGERDARAALEAFAGVARRLVVLSSGDVYRAYGVLQGLESGALEPMPLREDAPLRSVLYPYRKSAGSEDELGFFYEKILVERTLMHDARLPATVLRLPAVYGPGDAQRRLSRWIMRMRAGRPALGLDAREATWRWTHGYVENVAAAIALATVEGRAAGRVYNVGEEPTPTVSERVRELGDALGWRGEIVPVAPERWRQSPPLPPMDFRQDLIYDTSRIRTELGFREPVSREAGFVRTAEWEQQGGPEISDQSLREELEAIASERARH